MLNEKQKSFIADPASFVLKNQVDDQVNKLLYSFQQALALFIKESKLTLPSKLGKTPFKVNKGNNHKGYPFQVIDYPASLGQEHAFSFRSVIWYANFFSFSLILKGKPKENYQQNLRHLVNKDFMLTTHENIWETHISEDMIMRIQEENLDEVLRVYAANESIKIFKSYNLNQIDDFERLGVECLKDLFTQD